MSNTFVVVFINICHCWIIKIEIQLLIVSLDSLNTINRHNVWCK